MASDISLEHHPILLVKLDGVAAPWVVPGTPMAMDPCFRHALTVYATLNPGHVFFITSKPVAEARAIIRRVPSPVKNITGFHSKALDVVPILSCPSRQKGQKVSGPKKLDRRKFIKQWADMEKDTCPIIFMCDQPYQNGPDFEVGQTIHAGGGALWQVTHRGATRLTGNAPLVPDKMFSSEDELGRRLYTAVRADIPPSQGFLARITPALAA